MSAIANQIHTPHPQEDAVRHILEKVGVDTNQAAAIMLDLDPIPIGQILGDAGWYYYDPQLPWVQGPVGQRGAHVTLLYGLVMPLAFGKVQINSRSTGQFFGGVIHELLADLELEKHGPTVQAIDVFENDPRYSVLVARVDDDRIREANRRLRWLPHIDTFVEFKAHVTLAYLESDAIGTAAAQKSAASALIGQELKPRGLNLGGEFK
jgi:hypothetical protein